ncbi:MAG: hypothetical protein FD143_2376 [Ignavibacteria bacterium]|nr:MAG: hypothetical protein FD143_2376 [Ignavibacteria bacterium]KAF0157602.1 MAG: hypothetical protein FD188_2701 [Ignavibacteria bacterium]
MTHINESEVELFLLKDSEFSDQEREFIQKHLSECTECLQKYNNVKLFYSYIESNINSDEKEDEILAGKIINSNTQHEGAKLLNEQNRAVKVYNGTYEIIEVKKDSLVKRAVELIKIYPHRFTGSLAFVGLIVTLLFIPKKPEIKHVNPSLAIIKDNVLSVYNEMGDLMWKKGVPGMTDFRTDFQADDQIKQVGTRTLLLDDLNNDGINELLITGNPAGQGRFAKDTLYCFDPYGELMWKHGCGSFKRLNTRSWKHNDWFISNFFTIRTKNGKKLFVVSGTNFAPAKIFELDFNAGKIVQEFYNSGGIITFKLLDINGDGYDEIILGGINNAFSSAFIAVFNPDSVSGFSFSTENFIQKELQQNSALKYILLPATNYNKAASLSDFNMVEQFLVSKEDSTITAYTQEAPSLPREKLGAVLYNFDFNWNIRGVILAHNFVSNYNRLLAEGKVKEPLDSNYRKKLAEGVRLLK